MRKRKIKRKGHFFIFRFVVPFIALFVIFSGLYFYFPIFINKKVLSPLAGKIQKSDKDDLASSLSKAGIPFSSIDTASDSSYFITLTDGGQAIITPKKNIEFQISSLQLMLNRLTIEGKRIKTIDFRYDRPVVRL